MSPDEVIAGINNKGISSSRATLLRYENARLISSADRGSGGRGLGKYTEYPVDVVHEYFASYHVIKTLHASQEETARARRTIIDFWLHADTYSWYAYQEKQRQERQMAVEVAEKVEEGCSVADLLSLRMNAVIDTPYSIDWWEYYQASQGAIDQNYISFHRNMPWDEIYPDRYDFGIRIDSLQSLLTELLEGLNSLSKARAQSNDGNETALLHLEYWNKLHRCHPEIRPLIRSGMLSSYRGISPKVIDLIITGKLPEG